MLRREQKQSARSPPAASTGLCHFSCSVALSSHAEQQHLQRCLLQQDYQSLELHVACVDVLERKVVIADDAFAVVAQLCQQLLLVAGFSTAVLPTRPPHLGPERSASSMYLGSRSVLLSWGQVWHRHPGVLRSEELLHGRLQEGVLQCSSPSAAQRRALLHGQARTAP